MPNGSPSPWDAFLNWLGPGGQQALAGGLSALGYVMQAPHRAFERELNPPVKSKGSVYDLLSRPQQGAFTPEAAARLRNIPVGSERQSAASGAHYNPGRQAIILNPQYGYDDQLLMHEATHALDPTLMAPGLLGDTALGRSIYGSFNPLFNSGMLGDIDRSGLPGAEDYYGGSPTPGQALYWALAGDEEVAAMVGGQSVHTGVPIAAQPAFSNIFTQEWMNPAQTGPAPGALLDQFFRVRRGAAASDRFGQKRGRFGAR